MGYLRKNEIKSAKRTTHTFIHNEILDPRLRQMEYDAADKETDQKDQCWLHF